MLAPIETLDLSPGELHVVVRRGDDVSIDFHVISIGADGVTENDVDLTGATAYMAVARHPGDAAILVPTFQAVDLSKGKFRFTARAADINWDGSYLYGVEVRFASGIRRTVASGSFFVEPEIAVGP